MVEICSLEISIKGFMSYAQLFAEIVEHKTCHSNKVSFVVSSVVCTEDTQD